MGFCLLRNPNEPQEAEVSHGGGGGNNRQDRQERNKLKNIEWTAYEAVHKKYLNLGKI